MARDKTLNAKGLLDQGIDPGTHKKQQESTKKLTSFYFI